MTDNEIIKALECCSKHRNTCRKNCPLDSTCNTVRDCLFELSRITLDLINRQKAEIERLQKNIDGLNIFTKNHIKVIRLQAIKEFAERLKRRYESVDGQYIDRILNTEIDNRVKEMTEVEE